MQFNKISLSVAKAKMSPKPITCVKSVVVFGKESLNWKEFLK